MCQIIFFGIVLNSIDLVFHQSDERGNHNCSALHQQCRQLVAHRLTAACWHQHKSVIAIKQVLDDSLLVALESIEAKVILQRLLQ